MPVVIKLVNVTKKFGSLTANDRINLEIKAGTIHSIIGENGAGKSTLMNMLAGLLKPTAGEIYINGERVEFENANEASRAGIGMVHQEFMLFPTLTVLENIMLGREPRRRGIFIDTERARREIEAICEKYHFQLPLDARIRDLPVSIQQQVEIVKVLYRGADIIILDEPTAVLTPQGVEGLFEALKFLVSMGKTVIFITHKLKEVLAVSDYITVLKAGRVTGHVRPEDVDEEALANLMVGREVILKVDKRSQPKDEIVAEVRDLNVLGDDGLPKVHDVSFSIRKGEIVGVAGVAGNGQRELVEALFGLRRAQSGQFLYDGQDVLELSPREKRMLGIGYIPQDRLGVGTNTRAPIWENTLMGYHITPAFKDKLLLDKQAAFDFADQVVRDFDVRTQSIHNEVGDLSGGNIQKVVVGREFSQNHRLLVIEDPTRGIDVGAIEFIWRRIVETAAAGVSVLLVSHELNEIISLSDRVLVLYDGRLVGQVEGDDINELSIGLLMTGGRRRETALEQHQG